MMKCVVRAFCYISVDGFEFKLIFSSSFSFFFRYFLLYQEPMPVEQLVSSLCNLKQRYTQVGGAYCWSSPFLNVHGLGNIFFEDIPNAFYKINPVTSIIAKRVIINIC